MAAKTDFKKQSWNLGGDETVILPGIDKNEFGGWNGNNNACLTVCNNFRARDFMNNFVKSAKVMCDLNWFVLGEEQGQGMIAKSFDELQQIYKQFRFYLCLNNAEYEDGYNLSLLEAMMTGMPGITLNHPTSPIKIGYNGFRSDNLQEINKFLHNCSYEQALELSYNARQTVIDKFDISEYIYNWQKIIEK